MKKMKLIIWVDSMFIYESITSWLGEDVKFSIVPRGVGWKEMEGASKAQPGLMVITSCRWILSNPGLDWFSEFVNRRAKVPVLCMIDIDLNNNGQELEQFRDAGIRGFISQRVSKDEFLWGFREAMQGKFYLSSDLLEKFSSFFSPPDGGLGSKKRLLNKREAEILDLISKGFTNKEIAEKIGISRRTVDGHRTLMLGKFGARNSAGMIREAYRLKYLTAGG